MLLRRDALHRSIPRRVEPCTRQPLLRVVLDNPPPTNIGRNRKRGIAGARARANPLFSAVYVCVCVCVSRVCRWNFNGPWGELRAGRGRDETLVATVARQDESSPFLSLSALSLIDVHVIGGSWKCRNYSFLLAPTKDAGGRNVDAVARRPVSTCSRLYYLGIELDALRFKGE